MGNEIWANSNMMAAAFAGTRDVSVNVNIEANFQVEVGCAGHEVQHAPSALACRAHQWRAPGALHRADLVFLSRAVASDTRAVDHAR